MPTPIENESRETYARFVALRDRIDTGDARWSQLADFFTEDAVYIDPAWGRIEGRENIREFFEKSMAGLTGYGWSTPENWVMCDGPRVVGQWDQVLGHKPDGPPSMGAGLAILYYAGGGRVCYSHDMLNMTHVGETLKAMQWKPPGIFNMPPRKPNRDISLPKAWTHLDKTRATKTWS